jgi:homoserine kinase
VSHDEAIFNIARSSLLVHALTTDPDLLFAATEDKLHQRQRAEIMPDSWRLLNSLRQDGLAATISGAGPAVLILASPANAINAVEKVTQLDSSFTALTLKVDQGGVQALA